MGFFLCYYLYFDYLLDIYIYLSFSVHNVKRKEIFGPTLLIMPWLIFLLYILLSDDQNYKQKKLTILIEANIQSKTPSAVFFAHVFD